MALGLIRASLWLQSPMPGVTAFWGCRLVQAQRSPRTHLDPLEPGTATPKGARWGTWLEVKCRSVCQSLHASGPAWGGKPRGPFRGSVSQTQEKAAQATPASPAISKKQAGGLGRRRNLLTRSGWWAAGLTGPGPGLCLWRPSGCCSPRVWPANPGWCLAGYQGHQRGSFPMQIHRLLTNLPPHIQNLPPEQRLPHPGVGLSEQEQPGSRLCSWVSSWCRQ